MVEIDIQKIKDQKFCALWFYYCHYYILRRYIYKDKAADTIASSSL